MNQLSEKDHYDAIIIGAGIGGLTAAGLLAKAGRSVLLLERHDRAGGYAHGFKRKRYCFDSGVHLTSGCGPQGYRGGQVIYKLINALDIEDQIRFVRINPFSHAFYPGLRIDLPESAEAFIDAMKARFPKEEEGLRRIIALCLQLSEELAIADEVMSEGDAVKIQQLLPGLFKYRKATLADVYGQFIKNEKLRGIFATNWPYLGLPPSKVSFLYWSTMFIGYLVDGAYYCQGGFQAFADALVKGIAQHGGKIRLKSQVDKILIKQGKIYGVRLGDGTRFTAPLVVSNIDMKQTVEKLVGVRYFPSAFIAKIRKMSASLSIFAVYIATDLAIEKLNIGHESFCYRTFDHDESYQKTVNGEINWISITVPTLADKNLAPEGNHIVMLTTLAPYEINGSWKQSKAGFMTQMVDMAECYLPGLKQHMLYIDGGSPSTMERYTLNYQGSAYGWDVTPDQVGPNRIRNRSPLDGLYFAGHWSSPGGGVYGVCVSGVQAAQQILGITRQDDLWRLLQAS